MNEPTPPLSRTLFSRARVLRSPDFLANLADRVHLELHFVVFTGGTGPRTAAGRENVEVLTAKIQIYNGGTVQMDFGENRSHVMVIFLHDNGGEWVKRPRKSTY